MTSTMKELKAPQLLLLICLLIEHRFSVDGIATLLFGFFEKCCFLRSDGDVHDKGRQRGEIDGMGNRIDQKIKCLIRKFIEMFTSIVDKRPIKNGDLSAPSKKLEGNGFGSSPCAKDGDSFLLQGEMAFERVGSAKAIGIITNGFSLQKANGVHGADFFCIGIEFI